MITFTQNQTLQKILGLKSCFKVNLDIFHSSSLNFFIDWTNFPLFWTGIPKLYFQNSVLCTVVNKLSLIFSFISINFQPMKLFLCHMSIPLFLKSSVNILTYNGLTFNKKFANFIYICVFKSLLCLLYKVIESKTK